MRAVLTQAVLSSLLPALLLSPAVLSAESKSAIYRGKLGIVSVELRRKSAAGPYALLLKSKKLQSSTQASVFAVENPSRLVIDLMKLKNRAAHSAEIEGAAVSAIRSGIHPNKIRLVVDFKDRDLAALDYVSAYNAADKALQIEFRPRSGKQKEEETPKTEDTREAKSPQKAGDTKVKDLKEKIRETEILPKKAPEDQGEGGDLEDGRGLKNGDLKDSVAESDSVAPLPPTPRARPKGDEVAKNSKEESDKGSEAGGEAELAKRELASKIRSHVISEPTQSLSRGEDLVFADIDLPKDDSAMASLESMEFITAEAPRGFALVLTVRNLDQYTLLPRSRGLYELVLKDTRIVEEHLSYPRFPPKHIRGFEAVVAQQVKGDAVVKIFVEQDVDLSPITAEGKLQLITAK